MDSAGQKFHFPYECDPGKFTQTITDDPIPTCILAALNGFRRLKEEHRKFWEKNDEDMKRIGGDMTIQFSSNIYIYFS